jgi:hypothetical protein
VDILIVSTVDVLPTAGGEALAGEKLAVEILKPVHAADDLREGHSLHAAITLSLG